ncbi:MAG: addiction module protein [Nostoc sp. DedQUE12a]|nr:addiction module protein [Nostoc sp. DedQUE12a]
MTLENLEAEVLALPKDSQAALLARLLEHLGKSGELDQEVASIWSEEAEHRDREMDSGKSSGISAKKLFQQIRSSVQ